MEKLRRIIKFILPLIFILYWGGVTLFTHSHVVNGVIIVHSHPFKAHHQHTQAEVETIFFLDHYATPCIPVLEPAVLYFCLLLGVLAIPRTVRLCLLQARGGIRLRAPPACLF